MKLSCLIFVCAFLITPSAGGQENAVKEILIQSSWSGYAIPPHRQIEIRIAHDSNGRYSTADQSTVDSVLINNLLKAIVAPVNPAPSMRDLGLTEEWLRQQFPAVEKKNNEMESHQDASEAQKALFRRTFETPSLLRPVVMQLFEQGWHTDDNPFVRIKITLQDGSNLQVESKSQHELMLPWEVTRNGQKSVAFNRDISRAIVNLLPNDGVNRERLNGDYLAEALGDQTMSYLENDWNLVEVEEKAAPALQEIRANYRLRTAQIASVYSIYYGKEWKNDEPKETNLIADMDLARWPKNFSLCATLELRDRKVPGVDGFIRNAPAYETLALSVPWLASFLSNRPKVHIELEFVQDASLAGRGLKIFAADMRAIHRDSIARRVLSVHNQVALLVIEESERVFTRSYWIVLPNRKMILWRFSGPTSKLVSFRGEECSKDDPEAVGGCVGRTKLPNGAWDRTP